MAQKSVLTDVQHPLALSSFQNWLQLLWQNRGVERAYLARAASVTTLSLLTSPLRWYEHLRYDAAVAQFTPAAPPIFVIGHWRSGTTYLHNLLCQDAQFGYISTLQSMAPEVMFVGHDALHRLFGGRAPTKRPMDNMLVSIDTPQEEEMALASQSLYSTYHQWWFPRHATHYFERYALQEGISRRDARRWAELYQRLVQKLTVRNNGRRIVLKNPSNTGRIRALLEAFPGAKFIHIYRNPYDVFVSTQHLYRKTLPSIQLESISEAEINDNILQFYRALMCKYLRERELIPAGDLVEVRFEDLERDPLDEMRRVYQTLDLPGWAAAEPAMRDYIGTLSDYQKNTFMFAPDLIAKVNQHWRFAFERWDYPLLSA
jgi:hypothetical protein